MSRFVFCSSLLLVPVMLAAGPADDDKSKMKDGKEVDREPKPAEKGKKDVGEPKATEKKPAGLKVGGDLPGPFHPFNVSGARKGKYHCLISQNGLNPLVLIFIRDLDSGEVLKDLLQKLDAAIEKNPSANLTAMVVLVPDDLTNLLEEDDKRDALAAKLEAFVAPALKNVVLAIDSKSDVEKYLVDDDAAVMVILQRKYRIEGLHSLPKDKVTAEVAVQIMNEVATKLGAARK